MCQAKITALKSGILLNFALLSRYTTSHERSLPLLNTVTVPQQTPGFETRQRLTRILTHLLHPKTLEIRGSIFQSNHVHSSLSAKPTTCHGSGNESSSSLDDKYHRPSGNDAIYVEVQSSCPTQGPATCCCSTTP